MNQTRGIWSSTPLRASMKCKSDVFFIMGTGGAKFLYVAPCYVTKTVKQKLSEMMFQKPDPQSWNDPLIEPEMVPVPISLHIDPEMIPN